MLCPLWVIKRLTPWLTWYIFEIVAHILIGVLLGMKPIYLVICEIICRITDTSPLFDLFELVYWVHLVGYNVRRLHSWNLGFSYHLFWRGLPLLCIFDDILLSLNWAEHKSPIRFFHILFPFLSKSRLLIHNTRRFRLLIMTGSRPIFQWIRI